MDRLLKIALRKHLVHTVIHQTNRAGCGDRSQLIVASLVLIASLFFASDLMADAIRVEGKPTIGWNGNYIVGRWSQVVVPVAGLDGTSSIRLELSAVDSDGNRVDYQSTPTIVKDGESDRLVGLIKTGRLDGEIRIRINDQLEMQGIPGRSEWLKVPLKPSVRLVITVGEPSGFDFEAESAKLDAFVKVVATKSAHLPTNSLAYDGVSTVVLAGSLNLSSDQASALREWVGGGGRLVISLNHDAVAARDSIQSMTDWLPVKIGEQPAVVREFGGLESFAGKNLRIPHSGILSIPSLKIEVGETLAASRSDPYLVRVPYGMGNVSVLAMDLTKPPLAEWKALSSLCARLIGLDASVENLEKGVNRGSQLSSTGISDLATQIHATQEDFERIHRSSPWFVMSLLFALLIVVGPFDYLVVHRLLKKPHLTWLTFPCLIAVCVFLASWMATASNGTSQHVNELDIVNVDVATKTARSRHFVNLYSPITTQTKVAVEPKPLTREKPTNLRSRLCWQGVPESTFGGTLRETSFEQGARYQQTPEGELSHLPLMQWSSKALIADGVQTVEGLVESDLKASPTGRLLGTITHRFSDSIEDWMVVYRTVVYRHLKKKDDVQSLPLPPNQLWRVEQLSVHSRELRPYLTGIITMATPRFGQTASNDMVHQRTTYDPLSLDPASVVRILTFHDEVGAERYTGLTNHVLADEDCSHLLKMGRAVLFGRLKLSVATIQVDGKTIDPDRQTCFVRLILPVAQPTELMKDLKRIVQE